ncbi:MAG TPA: CpaF family protein [Anaerolineaceae bacterium]|nr:CpaF family protein [Anaerolineaceae bacterium]HOV06141.1 CpaF family protein [Anaerolineaceae bacterium]
MLVDNVIAQTPISIDLDFPKLRNYLVDQVTAEVEGERTNSPNYRALVAHKIQQAYQRANLNFSKDIAERLMSMAFSEIVGYGPITKLLDDPEISEVMVNGPHKVFIEKNGLVTKTNIQFDDDNHLLRIIEKIVLPLGRHVDYDSPTVDARLPDGSRVNAVVSPVALDGPSLTIRKFRKDRMKVQDLINYGTLTENMAEFLRACVVSRMNIVVSGGTGSGKTTLLNVLSEFIPNDQRIVTIEDAAELQLQQDHVVRMETKKKNTDGKGEVTIRDLVINALRMRPDRIVVGECRGGEALDMLQAMNTGHDGSLTTVHANSPRDAISRLEILVMMSGMDLPVRVIRQQVTSAVDVIVHQTRMKDGTRKITAITEVAGMEGDTVVLTDLFKFEQTGISPEGKVEGEMKPTGLRPQFGPKLEVYGFQFGHEMFSTNFVMAADRNKRK